MSDLTKRRCVWVDIFKGILISSLPWFHSGVGYSYASQFFIGAFFFISGYVTDFRKDTWPRFLWRRFHGLMVPYFATAIGFYLILRVWMSFSPETQILQAYVPDFAEWRVVFRRYGDTQVMILGATWFLPTLFVSLVGLKGLTTLADCLPFSPKVRRVVSVVISFVVFAIGLPILTRRLFGAWYLDCAIVGQFFVLLGSLARELSLFKCLEGKVIRQSFILIGTFSLIGLFARYPQTIEYAGHAVRGYWPLGIVSALNGILFMVALSMLLAECVGRAIEIVKHTFVFIGRNTLGVLFFHFAAFKIVYLVLAAFGVLTAADFIELFPKDYWISYRFAPLFCVIGVGASLALWVVLTRIPVVRFFLGVRRTRT